MWKSTGDDECLLYSGPRAPAIPGSDLVIYDFDGTLATYKSGSKVLQNDAFTQRGLRQVEDDLAKGRCVIIVSNRSSKDPPIVIEQFLQQCPGADKLRVYAASGHAWRKPSPCIWLDIVAGGCPATALVVGDAAGRASDHSADDRHFALNAGLDFFTPEEHFDGLAQDLPPLPALPRSLGVLPDVPAVPRALWIMVGSQGAGKSRFVSRIKKAYRAADPNRAYTSGYTPGHRVLITGGDIERNWKKKLPIYLDGPDTVVVDATNPQRAVRAELAALGRAEGRRIVVCHVSTPRRYCEYLNADRVMQGQASVAPVAIATYWSRFEPPTAAECDVLLEVPFVVAPDTEFKYRW